MRRPHTPCDIAPRTFRRRRLHGAGAGPVVARGWGWGWSTEGAEGSGPALRDAGRRPHRCADPRDAEPRRRRDSERGHTRKLAVPSRGSLQTPGCSQRCSRPRDEQRTPPRTAPPASGCAPGVRLYPMSGGTPGPLCAPGSPRFSTRGPVTAPELLSQALRYGQEPSRNRPASRSPCAARRPRTACCPSADGEPARPVLARRSRPKVLGARGGPAASAALLPLTQPSQDRKGPGPHRRSQTGANRCAHHGPRTRSSSPRGDHGVGNLCFPGREVAVTSNPNPEPSSSQLSGTSNSRVRDLNEPRLTGGGGGETGRVVGHRREGVGRTTGRGVFLCSFCCLPFGVSRLGVAGPTGSAPRTRACPGRTVPACQPPFSSGRARRRRTAAERPGFAVTDDAGRPACRGRKA